MTKNTSPHASEWLNGRVMYGGLAVRRIEVMENLRSKGVDEHSIGFFVLKDTVNVTAEEAAWWDRQWAQMQAIEALVDEGMTWSDAQAALMAVQAAA